MKTLIDWIVLITVLQLACDVSQIACLEPCMRHIADISTDTIPPSPTSPVSVMSFHVGTQCFDLAYAIEANDVECKLDWVRPDAGSGVFRLTRELYASTGKLHKYNYIIEAAKSIQYPRHCHLKDTVECHIHFRLSCTQISDPSQSFSVDTSVDIKISEHSKPKPPGSEINCARSKFTRLMLKGVPSTKSYGRLEHRKDVNDNTQFSSVCANGFDAAAAKVVCGEMCGIGTYADTVDPARYGVLTTPIRITDAVCKGREEFFYYCEYKKHLTPQNCQDGPVGVDCSFQIMAKMPNFSLSCHGDGFQIGVNSIHVRQKLLRIFVPSSSCSWDIYNNNPFNRVIPYSNCNTKREENTAYIRYMLPLRVLLRIEAAGEVIFSEETWRIHCTQDRYLSGNTSFIPGNVNQEVETNLTLELEMKLFKDRGFTKDIQPGDQIPIDHKIYAQISTKGNAMLSNTTDSRLELRVLECSYSGLSPEGKPNMYRLLIRSCPRKPNHLAVEIIPQADRNRVRLGMLPGTFSTENPNIALTCRTKLCKRAGSGEDSDDCRAGDCAPQHPASSWAAHESSVSSVNRNIATMTVDSFARMAEEDNDLQSTQIRWTIGDDIILDNPEGEQILFARPKDV